MQQFKRAAALLLCLVMLISCLPVGALAAEPTGTAVDAAVIFSDLHTSSTDYKQSTVEGIMTALKNTELPISSVTSAGDAFSVNADYTKYTGYTSTITESIQSVLGNMPVNYVWSDHDRYAVEADGTTLLNKTSRLVYGAGDDGVYGTEDDGNYYIYSLSMADLCSYDRYSAGFNYTQTSNDRASKGFTATVAEAIANFKADAAKLNKDRPLFITSHQPLYDNRNDNAFAEDWFDAINEVAAEMDVAFFYGHNHKYDTGSEYYYAKGSTMNVATADNWNWDYDVGEGYLPSMDLTSEQKTLNFTHMCAGYMAPSSTGSTSSTTREGVAVGIAIYDDAITYTTYDANGVYTGNYALNETVTRAFAAESGETVPGDSATDATDSETTAPETNEELSNSVTIGGSQTYEEKTVYVRVDSLTNGGKYLIVNPDKNQALINNNGTDGTAGVNVVSGSAAANGTTYTEYIENPVSTAVWTAATNGSGFNLTNSGEYLVPRESDDMVSSSAGSAWTYNGTNNRLSGSVTSSGSWWGQTTTTTYYVQYTGSAWANTTTASSVYLYKEVTAQVSAGPGNVTYTMQASDLKHNLVGDSNSAQLSYALLANEAEAATLPAGGSYTFGVSGDTNGIISGISDTGAITFTGETGACRVKVAYTWTDGDQTYTVYKYVTVSVVTPNNYPEYPDEGAVKVNKTGTGIDFQSSGIAQVEVSASGVPMKRGVDVIVMLDMSSSMDRCINCGNYTGKYSSKSDSCSCSSANSVSRVDELKKAMQSMKDTLVAAPGADDIKIAVADFNGRYTSSSSAYQIDTSDRTVDQPCLSGDSYARVLTGSGLNASAFVNPSELDIDAYFSTASGDIAHTGTNYDYAFDAIYQLGYAIKEANGDDQRDLYVLFMSDGAPNQFNYYGTTGGTGGTTDWNYWLTGNIGTGTGQQTFAQTVSCSEHTYYYDEATGNQHRMATAIKGDPEQTYEVIRKNQDKSNPTDAVTNILTAVDGKENLYTIPGLGATMYSVAFYVTNDGNITEESAKHVLKQVPSSSDLYIEAEEAGALSKAFGDIAADILYAAYNARFVDQMGDDYNLQMAVSNYTVVNEDKTETGKTITPKIEIISYDIYTRQDYLNGTITEDKIGDRKGTSTVLETVTFNDNGTEAYSDKKSGNILIDGVICAQSFWYNTNPTGVAVDGVSIPTGTAEDGTTTGTTNVLPSETFYWKMGTVKTSELAMRYYVYLEGSMEGTREGGSYPTNEYATLYYDNYLGNPCKKDTVSPVMAWKEANVSYAFYLVDEDGNIIVNQTTGQTGSFANKIAVTNPVVYETVLLNNDEEVSSIDIASLGVLPEGYTLYDYDGTNGATYTVTINSNTTGSWEITSTKSVATTYVTQYDPDDASAYSNALTNNTVGDDYTHTVVWFAVLWKIQALPDTVVVDYGLPVDISVLRNDMFGDNGKLAGVGAYSDSVNLDGHDSALASGFGTSYTGTYGTAKADASTGKVRYTMKDMQMNGYEKFAYAVNYTGSENAGYYYDTVTVIPATTIYYEDSFLSYSATGTAWGDEGTAVSGVTQAEDRPGQYSLTDANNIYGYDAANLNMSTFSLGTAKKVHVGPLTDGTASSATASFTFYGTGFDIISMTSNTTGVLAVKVTAAEDIMVNGTLQYAAGAKVKNTVVDTYYGYDYGLYNVTYTYSAATGKWTSVVGTEITTEGAVEVKNTAPENPADGATYTNQEYMWVCRPDVNKAMYQVPVLQANDLPYGKYNVTLIATYMAVMDDTTAEGYDLYLDAVRIYDPANDGASDGSADMTIENAYKADGEGWPSYIELRNKIIAANSFDNVANEALETDMEGLVFIDGNEKVGDARIEDYISYGPNNEVYLAPGQRVAFMLNTPDNLAHVHIGIKSADGQTGTYTITNIAKATNSETGVTAGDYYNAKTNSISTTTDMYYDLTGWKGDIIVISNTGDKYNTTGIISLTNIKSTYTSDPNGAVTASEVQTYAVMAAAEEEVTTENTETNVYMTPAAAKLTLRSLNSAAEEDVPEETEPETTVPEQTEPETTVPEETEPETTEPAPDSGSTGSDTVDKIIKVIGKLFGWLFG